MDRLRVMLAGRSIAALIAACLVLGACDERPQPTPQKSPAAKATPEMALGAYAARIVAADRVRFEGNGPVRQTLESPSSYLTSFKSTHPEWRTSKDGAVKPEMYQRNRAIAKALEQLYCTDELRAIMRTHKVAIASAEVVVDGDRGAVAMCVSKELGAVATGP